MKSKDNTIYKIIVYPFALVGVYLIVVVISDSLKAYSEYVSIVLLMCTIGFGYSASSIVFRERISIWYGILMSFLVPAALSVSITLGLSIGLYGALICGNICAAVTIYLVDSYRFYSSKDTLPLLTMYLVTCVLAVLISLQIISITEDVHGWILLVYMYLYSTVSMLGRYFYGKRRTVGRFESDEARQ